MKAAITECNDCTIGPENPVGYSWLMKSIAGLAVGLSLLVAAASCAASPNVALRDLPEACPIGDPGRILTALEFTATGCLTRVIGSLTSRFDIACSIETDDLFDVEARLCLVRDLLPLQVSAWVRLDRLSLVSTLLLGPVHVNYGRSWTSALGGRQRWGYVQYAFNQRLTLLLGAEQSGERLGPIFGLRIQPGEARLWGVSVIFAVDSLRITIGGVL